MRLFANWQSWWSNRQINWQDHYFNPTHSHRRMIIEKLKELPFGSILEIGCAAGANLYLIGQVFPHVQVGGVDINKEALTEAKKHVKGIFELMSAEQLFFSDNSVDVSLTDACLIYVKPSKIKKVLRDLKALTRKYIVLVELYSPSFYQRLKVRLMKGYYLHNYPKALAALDYYDIETTKIPKAIWPGLPWEKWGYIISAKIPL